ncbi:MAG: hypothetical protein CME61_01250, partial [Halobacteriovoraceae bacterium]|nr:hypothetical protein [Halobacteriovoraceae bacterium]
EIFVLKKLNTLAKSNNAKLIVVNIGYGNDDAIFRKITKRLNSTNIKFLNTSGSLKKQTDIFHIPGDGHPSAYAHSVISNSIARFISESAK